MKRWYFITHTLVFFGMSLVFSGCSPLETNPKTVGAAASSNESAEDSSLGLSDPAPPTTPGVSFPDEEATRLMAQLSSGSESKFQEAAETILTGKSCK